MASIPKIGPWITSQWKRGWETIPVVMAVQSITIPAFFAYITYAWINRHKVLPAEKYRMSYTVVRPGDPRIARINHESRIDVTGFLWPKLPHYQYPMNK